MCAFWNRPRINEPPRDFGPDPASFGTVKAMGSIVRILQSLTAVLAAEESGPAKGEQAKKGDHHEHCEEDSFDYRSQPWHRPGTGRRSTQTRSTESLCRHSRPMATLRQTRDALNPRRDQFCADPGRRRTG